MHRVGRKGGKTDRDVFGATRLRRRVLEPLPAIGDYGLSGADVESTVLVLDPQHAFQNDGELIELRLLAGFGPALGATHVGNADSCGLAVYTANVLVNQLGLVPCGFNALGLLDQNGHAETIAVSA